MWVGAGRVGGEGSMCVCVKAVSGQTIHLVTQLPPQQSPTSQQGERGFIKVKVNYTSEGEEAIFFSFLF